MRLTLTIVPCLLLPLAWVQAQEVDPLNPQEGTPEVEKPDLEGGFPLAPPGGPKNPQQEMIEAFHRVERDLETMSLLLLEASRGDTSRLLNARESGIEDLLDMAEERPDGEAQGALADLLYASSAGGQRVLEGIDEIIEIAESNGNPNSTSTQPQPGQQQSGQQQGQPQSSGSQQQSESGQRRMQGQERPGEQPGQDQGQPQGEQDGQQPNPNGEKPNSNQDSPGDPNQKKTQGDQAPDPSALGAQQGVLPGRESWGNLPIHVRDIFRADGSADMPARYRSWIDSYYRKLNRENAR